MERILHNKKQNTGLLFELLSQQVVSSTVSKNDIKVKKFKEIQCTVIESHQQKDCTLTGEIEFIATNPKSLLKKQPIAAGTHFEHVSARAIGDLNALSPEKKKLLEIKPVPFPNDVQMIVDCTEALKKSINEAINYNRGVIK